MITRTKKITPPITPPAKAKEISRQNLVGKAIPTELRPKRILWRIVGGGSYKHCTGEKFRRGQTFLASIDEIPKAFRDTIVPVDITALIPIEEAPLEVVKLKYSIVERRDDEGYGVSFFEVQDGMGKVVSEGDLTDVEAKELIKSLQG